MTAKKKLKTRWEKIGEVGVDSGKLILIDPVYIDKYWKKEPIKFGRDVVTFPDGTKENVARCSPRWFELIDDINDGKIQLETVFDNPSKELCDNAIFQKCFEKLYAQFNYPLGHPGLAVTFNPGIGDGCYEVWAKIGEVEGFGERILELKVKFI